MDLVEGTPVLGADGLPAVDRFSDRLAHRWLGCTENMPGPLRPAARICSGGITINAPGHALGEPKQRQASHSTPVESLMWEIRSYLPRRDVGI
jgi:hypothetical protein